MAIKGIDISSLLLCVRLHHRWLYFTYTAISIILKWMFSYTFPFGFTEWLHSVSFNTQMIDDLLHECDENQSRTNKYPIESALLTTNNAHILPVHPVTNERIHFLLHNFSYQLKLNGKWTILFDSLNLNVNCSYIKELSNWLNRTSTLHTHYNHIPNNQVEASNESFIHRSQEISLHQSPPFWEMIIGLRYQTHSCGYKFWITGNNICWMFQLNCIDWNFNSF